MPIIGLFLSAFAPLWPVKIDRMAAAAALAALSLLAAALVAIVTAAAGTG
jgi:hypothetical protein